jgi:hypothetical protein
MVFRESNTVKRFRVGSGQNDFENGFEDVRSEAGKRVL